MLKYFLLWFPMLLIAIGNGIIREALIKKYTAECTAHQISTVTLLLFFSVYIHFVIKKWPPASAMQAGDGWCLFWLVLTLTFEFGFSRWRGNSWETLLGEYNLAKGRFWILVPLWVTIAPYFFHKLTVR